MECCQLIAIRDGAAALGREWGLDAGSRSCRHAACWERTAQWAEVLPGRVRVDCVHRQQAGRLLGPCWCV